MSRPWIGRSSICFMSTVEPIALLVSSTRGAAPPFTSTISLIVPTFSVALMSVVCAASETTSSYTCVWKPALVTVNLYFPSGRLTKVCVPWPWVSPLRTSFVAKSRSSSCAACTTLPLGSRTVTVTVPSEPCCAQPNGMVSVNRRAAAKAPSKPDEILRDICPPTAQTGFTHCRNSTHITHDENVQQPSAHYGPAQARPGNTTPRVTKQTFSRLLDFVYFIHYGCQS